MFGKFLVAAFVFTFGISAWGGENTVDEDTIDKERLGLRRNYGSSLIVDFNSEEDVSAPSPLKREGSNSIGYALPEFSSPNSSPVKKQRKSLENRDGTASNVLVESDKLAKMIKSIIGADALQRIVVLSLLEQGGDYQLNFSVK